MCTIIFVSSNSGATRQGLAQSPTCSARRTGSDRPCQMNPPPLVSGNLSFPAKTLAQRAS